MHELSVVESMVGVVLKHAEGNRAEKVTSINLVLGEMSTIMEEPVKFYFEILSKGTIAQGAELNFERKPLIARCSVCGKEFKVIEYDFTCPDCGSLETEIVSGREFRVESIEIE
ncbi:MAG: hydrogenase maturation nickel metallochaperone HypA [Actinomycetota bacterium]|nr:hydrogenase maturation nickel metallochaperone HypA [Actinomycetota bacterium]